MNYLEIEENKRVVEAGKNKLTLLRDRATGFWEVHNENGPAPVPLRQKFTSIREAHAAIKNYVDSADIRKEVYSTKK